MSKRDEDFSIDKDSEQNSFEESQQEEQNYIEEMIEYQNHQLSPGYYVGTGKTPPDVKASGNAMPLAIWMFIQAVGFIIFYCFLIKFLFFPGPMHIVTFTYGSDISDVKKQPIYSKPVLWNKVIKSTLVPPAREWRNIPPVCLRQRRTA